MLFAIVLSGGGCERSQTSQRTIPYRADTPIAERLLPGDKQVLVEMKQSTPPGPSATPPFEEEVQILRRSEIIALVRVTATRSDIADRGTWVRTTVNAEIERLVHGPPDRELGSAIEFSYPGGRAQLGSVVVTTGKFPRFSEGEQYLVFLATRPGTASSLTWGGVAFRVDAQATLRRVAVDGGGEQSYGTSLVGRNVSEIIDALAR